jgi:diguanylate cyclase (GGDEF)-like protein/PAS domain S-box-containing protein
MSDHQDERSKVHVVNTKIFDEPGTILVVDDDPDFCQAVCDTLQKDQHHVIRTANGEAGLAAALRDKPDLILIDIKLPDIDGLEVCRRLKADAELRYVPLILFTGMSSAEVHVHAMTSGANDFLAKPFDWHVFKARVSSLLKYRRAVSALRKAHDEMEQRVLERTAELRASNEKLVLEINERKRAEEALRESEERYALAARGANDGLWDWNLITREVYFSPRWKAMVGAKDSDMGNKAEDWFNRVHAEDVAALKMAVMAHIEGNTEYLEHEYRMLYRDGTYRWMMTRGMAVRDESGKPVRMAGSQSDITVRKMAELQLLRNAFHDELTSLPNRALFIDRLGQAVKRSEADEHWNLAVFHLDVDRFKIINDSLGHNAGNQLLIEIGRRLRRCLRPSDTVARLTGDEFAVLVENIKGLSEANELAAKIHDTLKAPFKLRERDVFITASVGIVMGKKKYVRPEDLIRDSETAMHRAKAQGKARQETFHSGMHAQVLSLMHLENDLRRAVESNEFVIHYQPIISLTTGRISAFEALIRWKHPEKGQIAPGDFLPLAEETELITPISLWVLRESCSQLKRWQEISESAKKLCVSVNLSGGTFSQQNLVKLVREILDESKLPAECLKLEITEGVIMENAASTTATLAQLKAMNVHLMIDDFGTGYSSLSYLHQLPIDTIKIDRSFVSALELGDRNLEIVKTIASLAASLDLKIVAEGVETREQLAIIRELKCHYAQGFLFAKPVSADIARDFIIADPQW